MDDLTCLYGLTLPAPPREMRARVESEVFLILAQRQKPRRKYSFAAAATLTMLALLWFVAPVRWQLPGGGKGPDAKDVLPGAAESSRDEHKTGLDLKSMKTEELLPLREKASDKVAHEMASYRRVPISEVVQNNDLFAQVLLERIEPEREHLVFRVIESCPVLPDKTLTVSGTVSEMSPGRQYLLAFKKVGDHYVHQSTFGTPGDHAIEGEGPGATVSDLVEMPRTMRIDEAWKLIRSLFDAKAGAVAAPSATLDKLKNGTLSEAGIALETLTGIPRNSYTGADLVEALENQHKRLFSVERRTKGGYDPAWPTDASDFQRFTLEVLKLLYPVASEPDVDRLVAFYIADRSKSKDHAFGNPFGDRIVGREVVRLALKHSSPAREARVRSLLAYRVVGPADYGIVELLAPVPGQDITRIIQDIFAHPEQFQLHQEQIDLLRKGFPGLLERRAKEDTAKAPEPTASLTSRVERCLKGERLLFTSIVCLAPPNDTSVIQLLQEASKSKIADIRVLCDAARLKAPGPAFLPMLRETTAGGRYPLQYVLPTLAACGEADEALRIAGEALDAPLPQGGAEQFRMDLGKRRGALLALGYLPSNSTADLAKRWLAPARLESYQSAQKQASAQEPPEKAALMLKSTELRNCALLALTRLGDASVAEQWKTVFRTGGASDRMVAATALYYLGDDTGHEFIEAFGKHEEMAIDELQRHFTTLGVTSEFQKTILYLRSDATDALFMKRLQNGFGNGDYYVVQDLGFEMQHAGEVLPSVAQRLTDRDSRARRKAHDSLRLVLGENIAWDENALAGAQPENVDLWQKAVAAFLAEWKPAKTTVK